MIRTIVTACTAVFMIAVLATTASAATYAEPTISLPEASDVASSKTADEGIKLADGGFGAGLAVGIIGSIIVDKIEDHDRGYRYRRYHGHRHRSCRHWRHRCGHNWGYRNKNYYGCLRYHGC